MKGAISVLSLLSNFLNSKTSVVINLNPLNSGNKAFSIFSIADFFQILSVVVQG